MQPRQSPEFVRFIDQRRQLNDKLATSGAAVDLWIEDHGDSEAGITALARLEGLLQERRSLLAELAALDDRFVDYLIGLIHPKRNDTD